MSWSRRMVLVSVAIMIAAMKLQTSDDLRHPIVLSGARRRAKSCWDMLRYVPALLVPGTRTGTAKAERL